MSSLCLLCKQIFSILNVWCIYPKGEKKSLHLQCSIDHSGNCVLHHCAAFLWVIHMVAERIRWRLNQEFFQLMHKKDLKFPLKFWPSRWRIAVCLPIFCFFHCTAIAGSIPSGWKIVQLSPGMDCKFTVKGVRQVLGWNTSNDVSLIKGSLMKLNIA